jgi:hypothetical protein
MRRRRFVAWRGIDGVRAEAARVDLEADRLSASGTQIGADPLPYRLDYVLETEVGFVTSRLLVEVEGDEWSRQLRLERDPGGSWSCSAEARGSEDLPPPGGDLKAVAGALDCDLGLCPLTNTMPVLRHGLLEDGAQDFVMVWVSVPDLGVHRSEQRYEHVRRLSRGAIVRYVGRHRDFVGELELDQDGLVVHYPQLAVRLEAGAA